MKNRLSEIIRNYLDDDLDVDHVNPDPNVQFGKWFGEAIKVEVIFPDAMVLSTSDFEGNVSARMVLLKGYDKSGFTFFTNYRSRKGFQLELNPKAALTFHWKELDRQVRVEGVVRKTSRNESVKYFNSRPLGSRVSAVISPQSSVIPDRALLEALHKGELLDLGKKEPVCPSDWGGYRLKPVLFEFWQGRSSRLHDRIQYRLKTKNWIIERLAP